MTNAPRRSEFFALEANEYLADLEPLAGAHDHPDAERLVRGARALRGAALMAGLGTYARAAAGLEAIARQVRDNALPWEPHARDAWSDGLATLRSLVGRAASWEAADDRQALALAERFDQVVNGRPARPVAPAPATLTPGVRAFIARESALIAGSLEQASRALAPVPPAAALAAVLERMQSLRGLGASAELSPLPELLDAMEVATRTLLADVPAPPNVAAVFAAAAQALATMARSVADAGRLVPPPELDAIARQLLESYADEHDVVDIASLAPAGADSVLHAGTPPEAGPDGDPVPIELVSVGDHLLLVADGLTRPTSAAARDLRLFVLHRTLAAMPARSGTGRFLAPLAEAITGAIRQRVAIDRAEAFVTMLRGCGRFLVEAGGTNDRVAMTRRRDALAASLTLVSFGAPVPNPAASAVRQPARPAPEATSPDAFAVATTTPSADTTAARKPSGADSVVDIESAAPDPEPAVVDIASLAPDLEPAVVDIATLAPDDVTDGVVPIQTLAPDDDFADVVDIATLAPDPVPEIPTEAAGPPGRLEAAFAQRRIRQRGGDSVLPSLSGFIAAEIVPIEGLLYRGHSALARAGELQAELRQLLAQSPVNIDQLRTPLDELLDLVPLARDAA